MSDAKKINYIFVPLKLITKALKEGIWPFVLYTNKYYFLKSIYKTSRGESTQTSPHIQFISLTIYIFS